MVVGAILLDLLIQSRGSEFLPAEITQHVEAIIIDDLKLAHEPHPTFQTNPTQLIVAELYYLMLESIWPFLKSNPLAQSSARIRLINYDVLQIDTKRLVMNDGNS
jgi:hypothetical protein